MRPRSTHRAVSAILAVAVLGCGQPILRHLNGRALAGDVRFAPVERGWIAVDSCTGGIHAVVELEVDSVALREMARLLAHLAGALEANRRTPPDLAVEGPFCSYGRAGGRLGDRDAEPPFMGHDRRCAPVYYVRAEYRLHRLPTAGDRVIVRDLDRRIVVNWERR